MSKPREFYVPEEFVFNSVDEALDKYPDQAVSVLYDLADMKSAADKLADMLERMNNLFHRYNGREFQPALDLIKEYRGENE